MAVKYEKDVPAGAHRTLFFCRHPYEQRRVYWSVNDDGEREGVQVCRECAEARTVGVHTSPDDYWESARRRHHADGSLRTLGGAVLYPNWNWSRQR